MRIEPFGVEQWMNKWETRCAHNLAETCVESLTIAELAALTGADIAADLARMKLTYGAILGSEELRSRVAGLHVGRTKRNVLVTHGTIGANHMVYQALIEPGDHVVAITPTYQQHTAIPRSLGAEVTELPLREADLWLPDLDRLSDMVRPTTKIIALTHPNNPTGSLINRAGLERIAAIADRIGAWVLCDEVYRGTERETDPAPSIAELSARGISTGSMSKAFSLAGLRLGWVVGPEDLLAACEVHRDYTTISVGMVDDYLATLALGVTDQILARGRRITSANLAVLDDWIDRQPLRYIRPLSGTTALLGYNGGPPSYDLCEQLLSDTGAMLTPGSIMGMEGQLRIGFGNPVAEFAAGLSEMDGWFDRLDV